MNRVLVISPHPDDESIGCGGTVRRHVIAGDEVRVIFLTSGEKCGTGRDDAETARIREKEAKKAAAILGVAGIEFWRQPDGDVRARQDIVAQLRNYILAWNPKRIYVPHAREDHSDHRAAARIVKRALTGAAAGRKTPAVLMYEVWTPLQRIDATVDISRYIKTKLSAIRAHKSQCGFQRFDDAALALNRYRGEMHSSSHAKYAETFMHASSSRNGQRK